MWWRSIAYAKSPASTVFTRFEAAPTSADGELEDIQLAVRGAPLAQDAIGCPAIEEFGEGIFIHFDEAVIGEWLTQNVTRRRHEEQMRDTHAGARAFAIMRHIIPGPPMSFCTAFRTCSCPKSLSTAVIPPAR